MTVSPQRYSQVGKTPIGGYDLIDVLGQLRDVKAENRQLRRRVAVLETGRARWRAEARAWKWGMLHCRRSTSA